MQQKRALGRVAVVALAMVLALSGCRATVLYGSHAPVLVEQRAEGYFQLGDDDPRYAALERYLAGDAALNRLLLLYEHTTTAFLASGLRPGAKRAVSNHAVLVLGQQNGLLRDIHIVGSGGDTRVQLAMGVAVEDPAQLGAVAPGLARAVGEALMALVGQDGPATPCVELQCDAGPAASGDVLTRGLGAALEAAYLQAMMTPDQAGYGDAVHVWAAQRAAWLSANAYRQRFGQGPSGVLLSQDEAQRCPGVAGALFYRLIAEAEAGYPQRYMLWFANFEPGDEAMAKILLAANRLSGVSSTATFIQVYQATFPSERDLILDLSAELQLDAELP